MNIYKLVYSMALVLPLAAGFPIAVQAQPENSYQLGGAWYCNNGYKNLEMNV
jgi:hypothetical protein